MSVRRFAAAVGLLVLSNGVAAQAPAAPADRAAAPPLSIEDVWRRPAIAEPRLSPNGRYFAVLAPVNDRLNIAVIDLETRNGVAVTNFREFDVQNVHWVGNERLVFTLGEYNAPSGAGLQDGGGFFMVSRDGRERKQLAPTVRDTRNQGANQYRSYSFLRSLPGNDEEILVEGTFRSTESSDVYRLNVRTGRAVLVTESRPERVQFAGAMEGGLGASWVLDRNLVPRVAVSSLKDVPVVVVHYRKDGSSPWQELTRFDQTRGPAFFPLSFEADNKTLLVATNSNRRTMAVYRYDPDAKALGELVAEHPRFDMGADASGRPVPGPLFDPKTEEPVGFRVAAEKTETVWTDPAYQRIQRMVDGALPGTVNTFRRTPDGRRLVVTSYSDQSPTRWYLLDEDKRTLEELFSSRPWLKPDQLAPMRPFTLKTRDGLEIPSYYFVPRSHTPGTRLPTVVHIHGGPHVRADLWGTWSFGVREAQLLASRGYAVILPNFRITPGLGSQTYYAGFGSYGRQMVDDHIDAARWGVDQGFADPERICISGASYGGSAAIMAMARAPELFRCGVVGLIAADKQLQLTSAATDYAASDSAVQFWLRILGADSTSAIDPATSPARLADRVKGPVLMYAGAADARTPIEQTRAMRSALERAGNPPAKVIVKGDEGHGFGKLQNNAELYTAIFEFLDATIGPKAPRAAR